MKDKKYGIIYVWENKINHKKYVGQTICRLQKRINEHLCAAFIYNNMSYFCKALRKYGKDNFIVYKIDEAIDREELNKKEKYWIKNFNSCTPKYGYNLTKGGNQGVEYTPELLKKFSEAQKGHFVSDKAKEKMRLAKLGTKRSRGAVKKMIKTWNDRPDEIKKAKSEKISAYMKSHVRTEEHKNNISISKMGIKNGMYGTKWSDERKQEASKRMMGHKCSEETRKKISERLKGNKNGRKK